MPKLSRDFNDQFWLRHRVHTNGLESLKAIEKSLTFSQHLSLLDYRQATQLQHSATYVYTGPANKWPTPCYGNQMMQQWTTAIFIHMLITYPMCNSDEVIGFPCIEMNMR